MFEFGFDIFNYNGYQNSQSKRFDTFSFRNLQYGSKTIPPLFSFSGATNYIFNPILSYPQMDFSYPLLNLNVPKLNFTNPQSFQQIQQPQQTQQAQQPIKTQSAIELARKISKENKVDENEILEVINLACQTAKKYGVDEKLVLAVIYQESRFKNNLTSSAGAKGYMQLMPSTAKGLGVRNSMDPEQNIDGGVRLLKKLLDRYDGNITATLAAYNAGPGHVDDVINGTNKYGKNKSLRKDPDGIPNFRETKNYVATITGNYKNFSVA